MTCVNKRDKWRVGGGLLCHKLGKERCSAQPRFWTTRSLPLKPFWGLLMAEHSRTLGPSPKRKVLLSFRVCVVFWGLKFNQRGVWQVFETWKRNTSSNPPPSPCPLLSRSILATGCPLSPWIFRVPALDKRCLLWLQATTPPLHHSTHHSPLTSWLVR